MPIKDILLHLDADGAAQPAIDFAISLATQTGAHLTAAGIAVEYPPLAASLPGGGPGLGGMAALETFAQENRQAIRRAGEAFIANAPTTLQPEFTLIQGYEGAARRDFARLARYFDLSVIGQGKTQTDVVLETLFDSGRPTFIVPAAHRAGAKLERAMVCWDGGVQAARALALAMPLLVLCETIEIVTVAKHRFPRREPILDIARHLERHGLMVSWTSMPDAGDVAHSLLRHAADTGAGYVVMGAYGHWRLTEFIIGGTTRSILSSMTTPVLTAH